MDELASLNAKLSTPQAAFEAKNRLETAAQGGKQLTERPGQPPLLPPLQGSFNQPEPQLETAPYTAPKPSSGAFRDLEAAQSGPLAEQQQSDAHAAADTPLLQQQTRAEQQSVDGGLTGTLPPNPPLSASLDSNSASTNTGVTKVEKASVLPSERKVPQPLHQEAAQTSQPDLDMVAGGLGGGRAPQQLQLQPPSDWASRPIDHSSSVFKVLPS